MLRVETEREPNFLRGSGEMLYPPRLDIRLGVGEFFALGLMTIANKSAPLPGVFCIGWNLVASLNTPGSLYIDQERLVFRALWREWIFPRTSLDSFRITRILFWRAILIRHSVPRYAPFVAFRPHDFLEAQRLLIDASFHFENAKA